MGIAAVAMAASMFAADVSAKVNILGDLFNYDADGNVSALAIAEGGQGWNPTLAMSVSGDKAGASVGFFDAGMNADDKKVISINNYSVWFKPVDVLKVTVGNASLVLNQETIDYSGTASKVDANGYEFNVYTNGLSLDLYFVTGWSPANYSWSRNDANINSWFGKAKGADSVIGQTVARAGYESPIGTLSLMFNYEAWDNTFTGIGYANDFNGVAVFENVMVYTGSDKVSKIRSESFVKGAIDNISLAAFIPVEFDTKAKNDAVSVGLVAKASYAAEWSPYLYIKEGNFLAKDFSIEVKPGVTTSFGALSFDVALDLNIAKKTTVDVPMVFTVAF